MVGEEGFAKISSSTICLIGIGGVGSWAAESLARSGIGHLILVDLDDVCVTNINRQVQAVISTVGMSKVDALSLRLRDINPELKITPVNRFFSATSAEDIFALNPDLIIDCIDRLTNKAILVASAVQKGIPIVCSGSAGERWDPTKVQVTDLAHTERDPLLFQLRKRLRQRFGFPRNLRKSFGVAAVFAPLEYIPDSPVEEISCAMAEKVNIDPTKKSDLPERGPDPTASRSCNNGLGTASYVTGAFGFAAAAEAVKILLKK